MAWWWPFKKKLREVPRHKLHHTEVAAHFFLMRPHQQRHVLYYLGIPYDNHAPILDSMEPFRDVSNVLDTKGPNAAAMCPEDFMDKLKVMDLTGRHIAVVAVLQNIFVNLTTAKAYAKEVAKWPITLKS